MTTAKVFTLTQMSPNKLGYSPASGILTGPHITPDMMRTTLGRQVMPLDSKTLQQRGNIKHLEKPGNRVSNGSEHPYILPTVTKWTKVSR